MIPRVPRYERDSVPLLVCGDQILWIIGYTTSDVLKLNLTLGNTFTYVMPATKPPPESVLISESRLQNRIRELGAQISTDYENQELVLLGVLRAVYYFSQTLHAQYLQRTPLIPIVVSKSALNSCNS